MPGLPYSQDSKKFQVDRATGIIHSEMNTPGVRMAYAVRLFLKMVHETGRSDAPPSSRPKRRRMPSTPASCGGCCRDRFELKRRYAVDAYAEHKAGVDAIVALLPGDFKAGMENWEANQTSISRTRISGFFFTTCFSSARSSFMRRTGRRRADRPHGRRPRRAARLGGRGCWTTSRPAPT